MTNDPTSEHGTCATCNQSIRLLRDGTLRQHPGRTEFDLATDGICSGSYSLPESQNTVRYSFTLSGSSPHAPGRSTQGTRQTEAPVDSEDHWFLNTLRISQLTPAFPVGTKLVLTVPNPDRSEDDYVRTWEIVS